MALSSTVFKAELQIADMDGQYYATHNLTLAQHPSETEERMMVRLLAFMLYASDTLEFGKGLSSDDEPALWQKDLTGEIELWIEVGQPDERDVRKASNRAQQVVVVTYGRSADVWWHKNGQQLSHIKNLTVLKLPPSETQELALLVSRSMRLQCTIQDGQVWITTDSSGVQLQPETLLNID